jgi:hypothetical protein
MKTISHINGQTYGVDIIPQSVLNTIQNKNGTGSRVLYCDEEGNYFKFRGSPLSHPDKIYLHNLPQTTLDKAIIIS